MSLFQDRNAAGQCLADLLQQYARQPNTIILALPRGGVPLAVVMAKRLHLPLDVFLVRKLGTPGQEELALGAIAEGGTCFFNEDLISSLLITQAKIDDIIAQEQKVLIQRKQTYRKGKSLPSLAGQTIILVDDGIATGATVKAALLDLKKAKPSNIILAVPVAPMSAKHDLHTYLDEFICPYFPESFYGVGQWYRSFPQLSDAEAIKLLDRSNRAS